METLSNLHVLCLQLAFHLSQNQTLRKKVPPWKHLTLPAYPDHLCYPSIRSSVCSKVLYQRKTLELFMPLNGLEPLRVRRPTF